MTDKFAHWWKSTRSGSSAGNCLEVAFAFDGTVGIRDSKANGAGPVLEFSAESWEAFLARLGEVASA